MLQHINWNLRYNPRRRLLPMLFVIIVSSMYKSLWYIIYTVFVHNILPINIIDWACAEWKRVEYTNINILRLFIFLFIAYCLFTHGKQNNLAFHFISTNLYCTYKVCCILELLFNLIIIVLFNLITQTETEFQLNKDFSLLIYLILINYFNKYWIQTVKVKVHLVKIKIPVLIIKRYGSPGLEHIYEFFLWHSAFLLESYKMWCAACWRK